jgi:zinc protease
MQAVTMADIKAVYEKYIKGKNFIETSFVPRGQTDLIVENSVKSDVVEEDVTKAAEVKADSVAEEPVIKTQTKFDRSVQPVAGPDPVVTIPPVWKSSASNGMKIWGIAQNELPLIQYSIVIAGGHLLDVPGKEGLANLTATLLNDGTKNKTPEQLEDAIKLLGASISVYAGNENITISVRTLARNFDKTLALVEEMLMEPRWDEEQFNLEKTRVLNNIKNNQADPGYLASSTLNKLIFGEGNVLATDLLGTEASVSALTIDDLKGFWEKYSSPAIANFMVVGDIDQAGVETALAGLNEKWKSKEVTLPSVRVNDAPAKSQIYFVDVPGAKQSVIYIGAPSIARSNPDYYPAYVTNYKLGGSFNGIFNLILREEKGFTYGARSGFTSSTNYGKFTASSMVRTNSTLESVTIFKTEMEKYRTSIPQDYVDFTKSALLKSDARNFETAGSLLSMLNTMVLNGLPADYIMQQESFVKGITTDKVLELANKYIDPARMYYVVVGDAKTQFDGLEKVGLGKPVLVK